MSHSSHDPLSQEHMEEMLKHIKIYILVFVALAILTLITVWASYMHVSKPMHIGIALFIATLKGGLVAAFFMHLISERKSIHGFLIFTVIFFFVLLLLTFFTDASMLRSHMSFPNAGPVLQHTAGHSEH